MRNKNEFFKVTAIAALLAFIFTGVAAFNSYADTSTATPTPAAQAGQTDAATRKANNESIVKQLVEAGKLTQAQGTKVLEALNKGLEGQGQMSTGGPLGSLITDKTLTQAEADAVMAKLMGGGKPGGTSGQSSLDTSAAKAKYLDVAYAKVSSAQKLDIYIPKTGNKPYPVIIAIHGGAFKSGDKASGEVAPMLKALARGYAVVSVNYRLSGEAPFPAQINDVKAAIRFLRANAAKYNLNKNKFATWGGSAGGNLSALVGTSSGVAALEGATLGNAKESSKVQAVVDWFGPIYFSTMDAEFAKLGQTPTMGATNTATSPESALLGKTIGTTAAEASVKKASPQTYISKDDPAFFIQHGTADRNIPITQSINFSAKLKSVLGSKKVTFEKLAGAAHGGTQFETTANLKKVLDFLDKYMK
jgi:acetyl esterase/lipase